MCFYEKCFCYAFVNLHVVADTSAPPHQRTPEGGLSLKGDVTKTRVILNKILLKYINWQ